MHDVQLQKWGAKTETFEKPWTYNSNVSNRTDVVHIAFAEMENDLDRLGLLFTSKPTASSLKAFLYLLLMGTQLAQNDSQLKALKAVLPDLLEVVRNRHFAYFGEDEEGEAILAANADQALQHREAQFPTQELANARAALRFLTGLKISLRIHKNLAFTERRFVTKHVEYLVRELSVQLAHVH